MNKFISILIVLLCLGLFTNSYAGIADKLPVDGFSSKYDAHFRKASKRYFSIGTDWRWFKSQGMAESRLNPNAQSPVHAKGIMQIMDFTRGDIDKALGTKGNPFDARWSIQAGVYYDSRLYKMWKSKRPELDRLALMFASYNAGGGNLIKAQKVCIAEGVGDCNLWKNIRSQGHKVKSWKQEETLGYVTRITNFMGYKGY